MGLWGQTNPIILQAAAKYIILASYLPNMDRTNFNYININLYKGSNESFYAIKPSFFVYFTGDEDTD